MDELIAKAAERLGTTPGLVQRAAAARAAVKGVSPDALIAEWAGGEAAAPTPGAAPAAAPAAPAPAAPAPAAPAGPQVEVLEPVAPVEEEPEEEDLPHAPPEPIVPKGRRPLSGFPAWLAAAFLVIPGLALFYAVMSPDGPACGVSGQLAVNPVTGEAQNCDGSEYGVAVVNYFADGEIVYTARCAACHGADGGGGAGPALSGGSVLATFPGGSCSTETGHRAWVALGSTGWPEPTYGVLAKPVGGFGSNMPGFESVLSAEEIASVTLYERVAFGGEPLPEAIDDCITDEEITASG